MTDQTKQDISVKLVVVLYDCDVSSSGTDSREKIRLKKFMFTQKTKSSSPLKLFTIREKPTLDKKRPEASELDSITKKSN